MMKSITLRKVVFALLFIVACHCATAATQDQHKEWTPLSWQEVNSIKNDDNLKTSAKIGTLIQILDRRISMSWVVSSEGRRLAPDQDKDYAFLIESIATVNSQEESLYTQKVLQDAITELAVSPEIENKAQVRSFLYISLAYAGGKAPEGELLKSLEQSEKFPYVTLTTLQSLQRSEVPIRVLPILLKLTKNTWSYVGDKTDIGPPNPQRFYPLRSEACQTLNSLGVKCEEVPGIDEPFNEEWNAKIKTTEIKVDRNSLLEKLRQWFMSEDASTWQPVAEIIYQIPGEDVETLIAKLLNSEEVSVEKKRALGKNKPA